MSPFAVKTYQDDEAASVTPDDSEAKGATGSGNGTVEAATEETRKVHPHSPSRYKVIKFSKVSKRFILHHERARSFQDIVVSLFGLRTLSRQGVAMPRPSTEEFWALRDANFSIYKGESIGIVGENGSGKSTTLKLISRILEPTSGSVSVRGKVSALLELGTGFHPELTGRENIYLNGSLLGLSRKEMASRYQAVVDFSELAEFIDTPIKHYSSGMVMRLGFAIAINVDPDILLTDEVLAVGDEAFQRKCLEHIAELRKRGVTIVFVSHALEAIRSICQRAIWLDHGKVIADGPSGEVIDRYLRYENEKHAERLGTDHDGTGRGVARPDALTYDEVNMEHDTDVPLDQNELPPEDSSGAVPDAPGSRWTTGEVAITDVKFIGAEGVQTSLFKTEEPFTLRIFYKADTKLINPVFGIALYTENGTQINGPNTRFGGLDIPAIEGTGYVDYHIDKLPLLTGRYDVTVAVTGSEMTDIYDHQHRAYSFTVQPTPGLSERYGLVFIPSEWSFHPGA